MRYPYRFVTLHPADYTHAQPWSLDDPGRFATIAQAADAGRQAARRYIAQHDHPVTAVLVVDQHGRTVHREESRSGTRSVR